MTPAARERGAFRLPDPPFLFHPPSSSATAMQSARSSSATFRLTTARATIIPPMHMAAVAWAVARRGVPLGITLRSRTLTIARNTVSNAALARSPLRETSVGSATIGQEFSTSSKCPRDR